jgi:precorrin-6B methylase 2
MFLALPNIPLSNAGLILLSIAALSGFTYLSYHLLKRSPLRPQLSKIKQALLRNSRNLIQNLQQKTQPARKQLLLKLLGLLVSQDWLISKVEKHPLMTKALLWLIAQDYGKIQLNPCSSVYLPVYYDDVAYFFLTNDQPRNARYIEAINAAVKDKIVVEVGTGKDAILSRFCCAAGAKKVYAIEINERVYQQAKACVAQLGLEDKIQVILGDGQTTEIPELADICVSEILGSISSSEGVSTVLNSSRRFLKPDGVMIPSRSLTKIAAISLPDNFLKNHGFDQIDWYWIKKVFNYVGYPFDIRVGICNVPEKNIISSIETFEDLDFNKITPVETIEKVIFKITKSGRIDGFLLWLHLYTNPSQLIDTFTENTSWLTPFFPVFYPGVLVNIGDEITAVCSVTLSENNVNPDYHIRGQLIRQQGEAIDFSYSSFYQQPSFRQTPFYQELFTPEGKAIIHI